MLDIPESTNLNILSFDNKKGGVGKTTTAWNVSVLLALIFRLRVLLIDLDSDRCLTDGIGSGGFDARKIGKQTILDVLINPKGGIQNAIIDYDLRPFYPIIEILQNIVPDGIVRSGLPGKVDFIAGSEDLAEAPQQFKDFSTTQPVPKFEQALPWLLRQPYIQSSYDVVCLDIGPGWDPVTRSGLFASNYAVIPVKPASLDIEALRRQQMRINRANRERAQASLNSWKTNVLGVVISQVNPHSQVQRSIADDLRRGLNKSSIPCFATEIPIDDDILLAMKEHQPAWAYAPDNTAVQQFVHLTSEIVTRLGV